MKPAFSLREMLAWLDAQDGDHAMRRGGAVGPRHRRGALGAQMETGIRRAPIGRAIPPASAAAPLR